MPNTVKIAIVHLSVKHKDPRANRENLVLLSSKAADEGAKIILAPEMSLSGYIFDGREDILPHLETADGDSAKAFAAVAREKGVFLAVGFGEIDPETDIVHNSAFVFGPEGKRLLRYRKTTAESKFACPGDAVQDNVFDTPWGKVGVLICSDTYHALPVRVTVLKGAGLLLVPANWPPSDIFPSAIWRQRAYENGIFLAVANRTGQDGNRFLCQDSQSLVFDPEGETALEVSNPESAVFHADLPLGPDGRFDLKGRREKILSSREPGLWHRVYANLAQFKLLSQGFKLPEPGETTVHLLSPKGRDPVAAARAEKEALKPGDVAVLPFRSHEPGDLAKLRELAKETGAAFVTAKPADPGDTGKNPDDAPRTLIVIDGDGNTREEPLDPGKLPSLAKVGPLAIFPIRRKDLTHPETAIVAAKFGADLLLAMEPELTPRETRIVSVRPIDQAAIALCAENTRAYGLVPEGHFPGEHRVDAAATRLSFKIDSRETRDKRFQDRVDFATLLKKTGHP
ncbi:MAG: carbon-nitrogen hydrolase family protein [Deltaproteobacteria bacterium]|jgi:predicted amidohydrolase|nr:carbon-nitrogen hydrolase family protein [Deltaproteobacteria bacterium]